MTTNHETLRYVVVERVGTADPEVIAAFLIRSDADRFLRAVKDEVEPVVSFWIVKK